MPQNNWLGKSVNAKQKRIGLALGGGGARGLAHIIVLETLDEMGIRPHRIAGTSIGAVMGALYASGKSGDNIRRSVMQFLAAKRQRGSASNFLHAGITHWIDHIHPGFGSDRLLDTGDFLSFLHEEIQVGAFEELIIPLSVVTTDIWRHEPVVFDTAALFPALRASIAFPGLFRPLLYQERSLVDGGLVNPVPYDILAADCDISIAVDVSERWSKVPKSPPQFFDNIFNSFQAMSKTIIAEKLKNHAPDIYLKPDMVDIHLLDFGKAKTIFSQAAPIKDVLKRSLSELLK